MNPDIRALLPLRLDSIGPDYSTWANRDGEVIYLAHDTGEQLWDVEDLPADALWLEKCDQEWQRSRFLEWLRTRCVQPEFADFAFCTDCSKVVHLDNTSPAGGERSGQVVCDDCVDNWWVCSYCHRYFTETTTIYDDCEACTSCRDARFIWCANCDEYISVDDTHSCYESDCGCDSPAPVFSIRNDGGEPLANDTPAAVRLPSGVISDEGIGQIANLVREWAMTLTPDDSTPTFAYSDQQRAGINLSYSLEKIGYAWQTKDGNFTKRLSRYAYKTWALKIPPELISSVGNIASAHSVEVDFTIDVTRDLNRDPGEFANSGSCWWSDYVSARCALKNNGGFGLRTIEERESTYGGYTACTGRAWVMPVKVRCTEPDGKPGLSPTFETLNPDGFVVFNGYGRLEGYAAARIMAHLAGMTYRKIGFTSEPMYINNESGYLVAPEEIAAPYTDDSLCWNLDPHSVLHQAEITNEREHSHV